MRNALLGLGFSRGNILVDLEFQRGGRESGSLIADGLWFIGVQAVSDSAVSLVFHGALVNVPLGQDTAKGKSIVLVKGGFLEIAVLGAR